MSLPEIEVASRVVSLEEEEEEEIRVAASFWRWGEGGCAWTL